MTSDQIVNLGVVKHGRLFTTGERYELEKKMTGDEKQLQAILQGGGFQGPLKETVNL